MRVLWLTNDLPPRTGGIQQFVANLLARVHPQATVVIGPAEDDAAGHDAGQPYEVVRGRGAVLPTPAVLRRTVEVGRQHRPDVVVLGASWPLGELAGRLQRALDVPVVALSHGLEAGLASVGLGPVVGHATRDLAALTTISDWAEQRLSPHVRAQRVVRVPPGVDVDRFRPGLAGGKLLRQVWGIPQDATLVGCVSRLVPRKGQDRLLRVWPEIAARHPDAWLVLVGEGPLAGRLAERIRALGPDARARLVGRVGWDELPDAYAALDLFAMPCRSRLAGTDVEGLGIVYLEAQAVGIPAIAGDSGGAPEAIRDGRTGTVVPGRDDPALSAALDRWLSDPAARHAAGRAGRAWVEASWSWETIAARFRALLDEVVG